MPKPDSQARLDRTAEPSVFRAAPLQRYALRTGSELVSFPLAGTAREFSRVEVDILTSCGSFRTLQEHAASALKNVVGLSGFRVDDIMTILGRLDKAGAFVTKRQILCSDAPVRRKLPGVVEWLAIPTRGSIALTKRAVVSYGSNLARFGHSCTIFVSDDSRCAEANRLMCTMLRDQSAKYEVPIVYAGYREKQAFLRRLREISGAPRKVLELAMFGFADAAETPGANRNAILLRTVGSLLLSVDDDTVCNPGIVPLSGKRPYCAIVGDGDPQQCRLFVNRSQAMAFVQRRKIDVLAQHASVLGRSVADYAFGVERENLSIDLDNTCGHMITMMATGSACIRLTANGAAGDSGVYSPLPYLIRAGATHMSPSSSGYNLLHRSRHMVRQAENISIGHLADLQAMFLGIDNRSVMPPFFPGYRNEDGLFALLVRLCLPDTCVAHLPFVMDHLPPGKRGFLESAITNIRLCDIVSSCMLTWNSGPFANSSQVRMEALGTYLQRVGSLPIADFSGLVLPYLHSRFSAFVLRADHALRKAGSKPTAWATDVTKQIDKLVSRLGGECFLLPRDLKVTPGGEPLAQAQRTICEFGELLAWWPRLTDAASQLSNAGYGLGDRV